MGKALYRKYRSKALDEIVGQEHITSTLQKALQTGRISHAYLLSGPRGVGKTSIARILAHEINGLPYTDDSAHLDIIEIDAASNRRIDEIRDIREKVYMAPTTGRYKVYIIDEVHMLTREAFNALLKTLEEPPAHAVFILATTEAHKLPETIVSRTQHYTFKPVDQEKVVAHLEHIATEEKIEVQKEALALLAAHGGGSFRDSISLLDQASSSGAKITVDDVRRLLGIAPVEALDALLTSIKEQASAGRIIGQLNALHEQGLPAAGIARQLSVILRRGLADDRPILTNTATLALLRSLIEIPASHNPERLLEIVLIEAANPQELSPPHHPSPAPHTVSPPAPAIENQPTRPPAAPAIQAAPPAIKASISTPVTMATQTIKKPEPVTASEPIIAVVVGPEVEKALDEQAWAEILNSIKTEYNTLYSVLRMSTPVFGGENLELQFNFAFHQKRLSEAKNRQIIANSIKSITGKDISVNCTLKQSGKTENSTAAAHTAGAATPPALDSITNIFGGGEVLTS